MIYYLLQWTNKEHFWNYPLSGNAASSSTGWEVKVLLTPLNFTAFTALTATTCTKNELAYI